jgi:hypothetical protein
VTRVGGLTAAPAVIARRTFGNTYGSRIVGDSETSDYEQIPFPAALVHGQNLITVLLLQESITSSDVTMGLRVAALEQTVSARLNIVGPDGSGEYDLNWSSGTLQSASGIAGPWTDVTGPEATSPSHVVPSAPKKFFRLR